MPFDHPDGPFSPELVLVCPELREIALRHEQAVRSAARRPEPPAPPQRVAPVPTPRSTGALTIAVLAGTFALVAWLVVWEGTAEGPLLVPAAADPAPPAVASGAGTTTGSAAAPTTTPLQEAPPARSRVRSAASPAPAPAPAPVPVEGNARRVVLSADGLYVTSLGAPACPGAPELPWLLVSQGRFAWSGELRGYAVNVSGRLLPGDRISGRATYRGRGCARTITYRGRARRQGR